MTDSDCMTDARGKIKEIYVKAAMLLERMEDSERLADLIPVYNRVEMGIFRMVVMGEIKKGKSSFINALLGETELLPTASDIATSTVYKIIYGPEKKTKVFFLPDVDTGKRESPLTVSPDQLAEYGTESGNPDNKKRVDFIGVELPNSMLRSGLVIVDTPGVGGLFREHRDITLRYAPNADAVFFVVDSVESVISSDEILFLKELLKMSSHRVVFVQTKIDGATEDSWRAWRDRNQSIIATELGIPVEKQLYFPVSATTKSIADRRKSGEHLERSGYLDLLNYLNHRLIPRKEQALAKDAAAIFRACLLEIADLQKRSVFLLQQTSREKLADMQQQLAEKKRQMLEWRSTTFQTEIQSFTNQFQDLKRNMRYRLQNELETSSTGPLLQNYMANLRKDTSLDASKIENRLQEYQNDMLVEASTIASNIFNKFTRQFDTLVETTAKNLGNSIVFTKAEDSNLQSDDLGTSMARSLNMTKSSFESGRNMFLGGSIGFGAVKVLYLVAPPIALLADLALLAIVGGVTAGVWGAHSTDKKRKLNEALQRLEKILQELVQTIRLHSANQFDDMCVKLERESSGSFKKIADRMQQDLEKEIVEVQDVAKATKQETATKLKQTTETLDDTTKLLFDIEALLKA